ncbi:flagellar motor switch protein FliM [Microbacterium oxydans]|uniref:flagellar motor switch protein FliM n=1 Tax=Microbacterium oxydans TaxID=82380 RepID=UPI00226B6BD2|nr:flagellar motor switch protein FliM [Microbacterium oxydans]WAA67035.1 flagellar motor switch protein FliM [Microbacterium oxydans]
MVIEDSVRSEVRAATATKTAEVEVYDFGRSATLSREHTRALELAFETFSRQWSAQLSGKIHVRATIAVEHVGMMTYGEYAQSLPTTTTMIVCALPDSEERLIVQLPTSAATAWIVQMVGGRATAASEDRTFTPIEQALIRSLIVDAIDHLTGSLDGMLPAGITVSGIQYNSQFAQVAAAGEPVIVARFSMRLGGRTVPASVMLPASVLAGFTVRSSDADLAAAPGQIRRQVEVAPVELALRLAPRAVLPREVLDLAVGDIISFPHSADRPLVLAVGDQPVATAAVGSAGARLACVVTTTVPDPALAEESA